MDRYGEEYIAKSIAAYQIPEDINLRKQGNLIE